MAEPGSIAAVVPVRNEATTVGLLVGALLRQTVSLDSVVVVDAGSDDGTDRVLASLAVEDPRLVVVDAGPTWPGEARNLGIRVADADRVLLVDAGMSADESLVAELVGAVEGAELVLGSRRIAGGGVWRAAATMTVVRPRILADERWARFELTPCLVERSTWEEVGGFPDWRAGEDIEFVRRVEASGSSVATAPGAEVAWDLALDARRLLRKWRAYEYHNAHQGNSWHRPVVAWNLLGLAVAVSAVAFMGSSGVVGFLAPHVLRAAVRYHRHRFRGDREVRGGPMVAMATVAASVLVDLATIRGWVDHLRGREPREWTFRRRKGGQS